MVSSEHQKLDVIIQMLSRYQRLLENKKACVDNGGANAGTIMSKPDIGRAGVDY